MRHGILGAALALIAGATSAWGQYPESSPFGKPTVIPPPIPGAPFSDPADLNPSGTGPDYPTPMNWDQMDLNGPAGGSDGSVPRIWFNAEYLLWFAKPITYSAPLATTSGLNDGGVIGNATTQTLYPVGGVPLNMLSGFRVGGGMWFDQSGRLGFTAEGWDIGTGGRTFYITSDANGSPLLARPYVNNQNGQPGSFVVAAPTQPGPNGTPLPTSLNGLGFPTGTGSIYNSTAMATGGGDMNLLLNLYRSAPEAGLGYSLGLLAGVRFAQLSDHVIMGSSSFLANNQTINFDNQQFTAAFGVASTVSVHRINALGPPPLRQVDLITTETTFNTVQLNTVDTWQTRNDFYGGNIGLYQQFNLGRWSLGLGSSLGIGDMHQTVDVGGGMQLTNSNNILTTISGVQAFSPPAPTVLFTTSNTASNATSQTVQGGLYNQSNTIGHYSRDVFALVPEVNIKFAYAITPAITAYFGYNVLFMSNVVRAPNVYTSSINPTLLPTSTSYTNNSVTQPFNAFPTGDFWIQGVNFGFNFRF